jgi:hypothetical protein
MLSKMHYFSIALARPSLFSSLTARDKNIKQKVLNNTNNSLELTENDNISLDISNVKLKSPSNYLEIDEEKVMYDRAVKNFIKLVTKDQFNTTLNNYKVLLAFLKKFDSNIQFSMGSFHNYRNRDTKFKPFIITNRIKNLIKYIQNFDKDFNHNMINVNNSSNVKSNKKSLLDHNIISHPDKTTTSILNVKSNKNLDFHLPYRAADKRSYSMSHTLQFFIIKPRLGCRYKSSYTYADIRRLKEANLVFDRSDYFLNTLDKKHELVPILMPDLSKYRLKKEEFSDAKKDVYGLSG